MAVDFSPDIVAAILEDALPDVVRLGALLINPPVLWGEAVGGAGNGACAASGKVGEVGLARLPVVGLYFGHEPAQT